MSQWTSHRASLVLYFSVLVLGCATRGAVEQCAPAGGQTYAEALHLICNVDALADLSASEDPLEIGQKRHDWLSERVVNGDAAYLRTILRTRDAGEQSRMLGEQAAEAGLKACPLARSLRDEGV